MTIESIKTNLNSIIFRLQKLQKNAKLDAFAFNVLGAPFYEATNEELANPIGTYGTFFARTKGAEKILTETTPLLDRIVTANDNNTDLYKELKKKIENAKEHVAEAWYYIEKYQDKVNHDMRAARKGLSAYFPGSSKARLHGVRRTRSVTNTLMSGGTADYFDDTVSLIRRGGLDNKDLGDTLEKFAKRVNPFILESNSIRNAIDAQETKINNLLSKINQTETKTGDGSAGTSTSTNTGSGTQTNSNTSRNTSSNTNTSGSGNTSTTSSASNNTSQLSEILTSLEDNVLDVPGEAWGIKFSYNVITGTVQEGVTGKVRRDLSNKFEKEIKKIKNSDLTEKKKEIDIKAIKATLEQAVTDEVSKLLSNSDQADDIVEQSNAWYMQLLPAMRTNVGLQGATDVPGAQPGLNFMFKTNVVKHKIPGFQPVYQSLGVDSLQCTLVGCFTGADGPQVGAAGTASDLRKFRGGYNPDIDFLNPYAGQGFNDLISKFDSFKSYQSFLHNIVVPNREVTIEINFGRYGQTTNLGNEGFLRSVNGNPSFTALIKSLNAFYVRYDRTWYIMEIEITDAGLTSNECLNLTNIVKEAVDVSATNVIGTPGTGPTTLPTSDPRRDLTTCEKNVLRVLKQGNVLREFKTKDANAKVWLHETLGFAVKGNKYSGRAENYQDLEFLTRRGSFNAIFADALTTEIIRSPGFGGVGAASQTQDIKADLLSVMIKAWAGKSIAYNNDDKTKSSEIFSQDGGWFTAAVEVFYYPSDGTLELYIDSDKAGNPSRRAKSIKGSIDLIFNTSISGGRPVIRPENRVDILNKYFNLLVANSHFGSTKKGVSVQTFMNQETYCDVVGEFSF